MDYRTERGYFSAEFKKSVVLEFESGKRDIHELNNLYQIRGHSTILKWCRLYGSVKYPTMRKIKPSSTGKTEENILLTKQIYVLERELKEARLKQATLETLIDIAEEHYSIVIKKNFGGKQLFK